MKFKNNLLGELCKVMLVLSVSFMSSCGSDDAQDLIDDLKQAKDKI